MTDAPKEEASARAPARAAGSARATSPARRRLAAAARILVALAGLGVLVFMIAEVGVDALLEILGRAVPFLPVVVALEGARIGTDALSTRYVLGPRGARVPFATLYLAQVVAHGVMNVFPAGRSASEAAKAALLSPYVGIAPAAAVGYTNQANILISSAAFTVLCLLGVFVSPEPTLLAAGLVAHTVVLFVAGVGMRLPFSSEAVAAKLARFAPKLSARLAPFREASRETPVLAPKPLAAAFAGRAVQTIEYAVIAHAVGVPIGPLEALAVQGVNLVAAAVGVFVPAQLGSSEAIFAVAAEVLDTDVPRAMSIALFAHAVSLGWVALGLVVLLLWRARRRVGTA